MKLKPIFILPILFALVLAVGGLFLIPRGGEGLPENTFPSEQTEETTGVTEDVTEEATEEMTGEATEEVTEEVTEEATEEVTEPVLEEGTTIFTLSFVGDCTFGSTQTNWEYGSSFVQTVGGDYSYPFANVAYIFENDDFTLANLEGPLTEVGTPAQKDFVFRGKPEYTAILTENGVEAVSIANNHILDYDYEGRTATREALTAAGIAYGGREESFLYTTPSGLTVGVYCDDFAFDRAHMETAIASLREQGAEIVVCAFHWGQERSYTQAQNEIDWGHIAIDAGADIVAGHHPHVLQPMEFYNGGVILYSLGNFSFGGNANPSDMDTVIVQQQVLREPDGTVTLGELTLIPCCVSSVSGYNNFQPTPYDFGSEGYDRVLQKLTGTYQSVG